MEKKLQKLNKEDLQAIILEMMKDLSDKQYKKLEMLIKNAIANDSKYETKQQPQRMSQEFIDEKLEQIKNWMYLIDEGKLYLDSEEYEDYSENYWDRDWVIEYFDNQEIGDKITSMIHFAKDCVDDRRYQEANGIYEWLWSMSVYVSTEFDDDSADLEILAENHIIHTDMRQLALLTLYADYQVQEPENRAEDLYLYFSYNTFQKLQIEDMFYAGRENLTGIEQFWEDWIALLQTKSGEMESRLLKEAVFQKEGLEGLLKIADANCNTHPSLYLNIMDEYDKKHDYVQIEEVGKKALEKINEKLKIRSQIALRAAYASSCLMHEEDVMWFCWKAFCSDTTDRNFLRLFGTNEMAEQYGMRGQEAMNAIIRKGRSETAERNPELAENILGTITYHKLCFYTGNFAKVKEVSRNPKGSLGWSGEFIPYGIRLFLLYLYEKPLPSKAADYVMSDIDFGNEANKNYILNFENEIIKESSKHKISVFWNYFQRWKSYFPITLEEKKKYLAWTETIVYSRADAIVSNQHRGHYREVAALLAMVAEVKEGMGMQGAKMDVFAEYKRKFPRHSSFQSEMKTYFNIR